MSKLSKKVRPVHYAKDFDLDVLQDDLDMFRWFLLCYLFGKPIKSEVAVTTWRLFIHNKLDTPWVINKASERKLTSVLHSGGYARYQHVTARGLKLCMDRLVREYDGSLLYMLQSSQDEDEFSKRLIRLYGVGPKVAEIFMRETEELFARRSE